jgi:hypothetical protein
MIAALRSRLYRAHRKRNPAWPEAHYADWARSDLIWRLAFLQEAGCYAWIEARAPVARGPAGRVLCRGGRWVRGGEVRMTRGQVIRLTLNGLRWAWRSRRC